MNIENNILAPRAALILANRRQLVSVGLLGLIVVHILDLPSKITEVPYLAASYVGAISIAALLIERLNTKDRAADFAAAAGLSLAVLTAFVVNRTTGMPLAIDDIGNWLEPLGLLSMCLELWLVYQGARGFALARRGRLAVSTIAVHQRRHAAA